MKQFLSFLLILAVVAAGHVARADEPADKAQLLDLEKSCAASLVKGDFDTLGQIFAEDWVLVSADGQLMSRAQIFQDLKSGNLKFSSYELGEIEVRIFGDTAIVIGHGNPHGEFRGEKFEEKEIFSDTFIRKDGKWHCILSHSSEMAAAN